MQFAAVCQPALPGPGPALHPTDTLMGGDMAEDGLNSFMTGLAKISAFAAAKV